MARVTKYNIGYKEETTFGVRVRTGGTPFAATVTYAIGSHKTLELPVEIPSIVKSPIITSYDPNDMKYGAKEVAFDLKYGAIEFWFLKYLLGEVSTPGPASGIYTNTITCSEPADSTVYPSRTFHIETDGLTTDKLIDVCGAVGIEVDFGWVAGEHNISVREKIIAQRITDEAATHDLAGGSDTDYAAENYTDDPIWHDTDLTEADVWRCTEVTHNTTNVITSLLSGNLNIKGGYHAPRTNRTGTDNYDNTINKYITNVFRKQGEREYTITLALIPDDNAAAFLTSLQQNSYNNDMTIKFERQTKVTDKAHELEFTFDTSTALIADISGMLDLELNKDMVWTIIIKPKTLITAILKNAVDLSA